ncbi:MAG: protein translocase subunit SecD [bacterium]
MKKNRTLIIIVLLCIIGSVWALLPTWQSQDYRSTIDAFTPKDSVAKVKYLAEHEEGIKSSNKKAIKLGLDLRGGIYVTMEVDVLKFIEEQATGKDQIFDQVIAATRAEELVTEDPVVSLFIKKFTEIASPKGKALANYFLLNDVKTGDDKEITASLQAGSEEAVDRAIEIIRNRIDQFGLTEPTIQKFGTRRIIIEVPGAGDPAQVRQLLEGTAQLEFKLMKDPKIVKRVIDNIDKYLAGTLSASDTSIAVADTAKKSESSKVAAAPIKKSKAFAQAKDTSAKKDTTSVAQKLTGDDSTRVADSLSEVGMSDGQKLAKYEKAHPFTKYIAKGVSKDGRLIFVSEPDRKAMLELLARKDVKAFYDGEMSFAFSRSEKGQNGDNYYMLYFLNSTPELTGKYITGAEKDSKDGKAEVTMQMDDEGARIWERVTGENVNKQIAIVLDGVVYSAPNVHQKISGGNSQITGMRDLAEANLLKIVLKAGALPAPVKIIQEQVVGPSLGADSIAKGTESIIFGFLAVIIFMALYYVTGGFVADFAVLINLLFTLAVLATFGATLTLPGMAGLVLTVGIAVDANVLIYERIREELASGKSLKLSIEDGYRRAFAPIFDGHLTAFFSGVILYSFGTGTIQGFAVTLMIGIAASLFTAIVITRIVFDILLERAPGVIKFG